MRLGGANKFMRDPGRDLAAQDTVGGTPSQRNIVCVWYNILLCGYSREFDQHIYFFSSRGDIHTTPSKLNHPRAKSGEGHDGPKDIEVHLNV